MSSYDDIKHSLENAQSFASDAYDAADSAERYCNDASGYASRASDAIETALEQLETFQPYDSNELERLMEIQFVLVETLAVNARRINSLVNGEEFTYSELQFLRNLHNTLAYLTTRGPEDIMVYSNDTTQFEIQYLTGEEPGSDKFEKIIKFYVGKKEATNVQG